MENTSIDNKPEKRGFFSSLREGFGWFGEFIDSVWAKSQNLVQTNYELGCEMVGRGEINDAVRRFKIALWLQPDHVPSLYNLGCLYHHLGQEREALDCFVKALKKEPMNENAIYMASTINPELIKPELRPRTVPYQMVLEHFDGLAGFYDQEQQHKLYQLPTLLHQLLGAEMDSNHSRHDLVDLGCGTGLCGAQFREQFANIVGVDISNNMLDEAYRRFDSRGVKIYTRLAHQDLRSFLKDAPAESIDVATCISVFPYLGDVRPVFEELKRTLRPQGLFACSFDPYHQRNSAGIMTNTGYFGHDVNYIIQLAQEFGFETLRTGEVQAYQNDTKQLCIFKKP